MKHLDPQAFAVVAIGTFVSGLAIGWGCSHELDITLLRCLQFLGVAK